MTVFDRELLNFLDNHQVHNKPMGLVTGVFDLLHPGHLQFLQNAKKKMDMMNGHLLVGLESDLRVRQLKGDDRPINHQQLRKNQLLKTNLADLVFILPDEFGQKQVRVDLLVLIKPKLMLVSSSTPNIKEKTKMVENVGGKVEVICGHYQQYSTTQLLNKQPALTKAPHHNL